MVTAGDFRNGVTFGEYSTCPHLCEYCYANTNKLSAKSNYKQHLNNSFSETITGK